MGDRPFEDYDFSSIVMENDEGEFIAQCCEYPEIKTSGNTLREAGEGIRELVREKVGAGEITWEDFIERRKKTRESRASSDVFFCYQGASLPIY